MSGLLAEDALSTLAITCSIFLRKTPSCFLATLIIQSAGSALVRVVVGEHNTMSSSISVVRNATWSSCSSSSSCAA